MELKPFLRINEQLSLHLARPELAPAIFEAIDGQRDYLRQWLPWVDFTHKLEDTEAFIKESMGHNTAGTKLITFVLAGNQLAGSVGVVNFNKDNNSCEMGYWLREDLQGRGIMTQACQRFVNHLFNKKSLNRIELKIATANLKSQALASRIGFNKEGTMRQGLYMYKKYFDLDLFSLLRHEWESQGQA